MKTIDFYLGGEIGHWAISNVDPKLVRNVFTMNSDLGRLVQGKFPQVVVGNANSLNCFEPANIAFSVHYERLLRPPLIARYENVYNLHPGYLPWGRGYYPVFWALWEQTPAGATLHEINSGIDEGPVVDQTAVLPLPSDTGGSLHARVIEAEKDLFRRYWPKIVAGEVLASREQCGCGTYHSKADFLRMKRDVPINSMSGCDLIRLIRALTFQKFTGLELQLGECKFHVRLEPMPVSD